MKYYEVIKGMNAKEMTGVFFSFLLPWIGGEKDEVKKRNLWKSLEAFLNTEVDENGIKSSEKQP